MRLSTFAILDSFFTKVYLCHTVGKKRKCYKFKRLPTDVEKFFSWLNPPWISRVKLFLCSDSPKTCCSISFRPFIELWIHLKIRQSSWNFLKFCLYQYSKFNNLTNKNLAATFAEGDSSLEIHSGLGQVWVRFRLGLGS